VTEVYEGPPLSTEIPDPDPWTVTFHHGDHDSVLRFWKDGSVTFEGDADEAAKQFFEAVGKCYRAGLA
jgi:hypothetical protein